ncbi:nucleoside-triphosphatase [Methanosarcina thermophila]|uniref:Nucleoside-triphosphatase SAMN02910340_02139 n=2 Tax=Methanosarcina thermophila TaxID=2210 RepID=A0A1I7AIR0_METTE|nr:NTPase [Methanosarcina thermophila]AKB12413.1 putative NTPase [Methanosarcina thermophila TM-1]SFT74725.1 nucleoside-triphosphatase [Methanosarcina thermophila]HOA69672.1 NTPase [Methanosarcina thermophila]HOQ66279.1 NTPase [Methanosarcina thermophila]HPT81448.1 NTPase [Methanosarcina thermophila]
MLRIAVTGSPGIGKSTVVAKVAEKLADQSGLNTVLRIAVTGSPGIGKSTVVAKVAEKLADQSGLKIGGIQTAEIRNEGEREGFSIKDLATGKTGLLASIRGKGPRVGKYHVNLKDLERIGANALRNALDCDLIVIDEVGPMELKSEAFVSAVEAVLESNKPVLAVLHRSSSHQLAQRMRKEFEVFTVDEENRDELPEKIINRFMEMR